MAKKKKQTAPVDTYPKTVEIFAEVSDRDLQNLKYNSEIPSCFNGIVSIKKYRITVELIEEPIEVYQERLEKLWLECDNHHHWWPLQDAAKEIGYTFKGERGSQRKK